VIGRGKDANGRHLDSWTTCFLLLGAAGPVLVGLHVVTCGVVELHDLTGGPRHHRHFLFVHEWLGGELLLLLKWRWIGRRRRCGCRHWLRGRRRRFWLGLGLRSTAPPPLVDGTVRGDHFRKRLHARRGARRDARRLRHRRRPPRRRQHGPPL